MKIVSVGIIGLGVVGSGAARLLLRSQSEIAKKTGVNIRLKKIATLPPINPFHLDIPDGMITQDAYDIINDPDIDVVVETMGGTEPAKTFVLAALAKGKQIVTANKKLLSEHNKELFTSAFEHKSSIGFEATTGGGIPCILALRDGLIGNHINTILGIVNGTSNYILTHMVQNNRPFDAVLKEAQDLGYAEADPTLDVGGGDSAHKLSLLGSLAFDQMIDPRQIMTEGITGITLEDVAFARELGFEIKLLAVGKRLDGGLDLRVHPTLVPAAHPLAAVNGVFNAIYVVGDAVGEQMFYGKGAGQMPTGSAIFADVVAAARGTARQTFAKLAFLHNRNPIPIMAPGDVETSYFIRIIVRDVWGVVGQIGTILGEHRVSLRSLIQHDTARRSVNGETGVPIVLLTHKGREQRIKKALEIIGGLPFVIGKPSFMRVEGEQWGI